MDGSADQFHPAGMSGDGFGLLPFRTSSASGPDEDFVAYLQTGYNTSQQVVVAKLATTTATTAAVATMHRVVNWPREKYGTSLGECLALELYCSMVHVY